MVKNEEDIIESFIRYNLNIMDEMIVLDNGSSDNTLNILNNLKAENLPISVIIDEDNHYNQDMKLTKLMYQAFDDYDADIVCVLDADEFISSDNQNPREILQNIDLNKYYLIKWQTYVPTEEDDPNVDFIPLRINHIRDEMFDRFYKVIVPKGIIKNRNIALEMGSHDLVNVDLTPDKSLDLKIAHFPLRSKEQTMSKILVGWPNMYFKNRRNNKYGTHWKLFFDKIKENGSISDEDLMLFSKNYALANFEKDMEIHEKAMNLDFCEGIEIKYGYYYNYLRNILENYIYYVDENIRLNEEINDLRHNSQLNEKLIETLTYLDYDSNEENEIISSDVITYQDNVPMVDSRDDGNESYLISVIIPVYNGEEYIEECLDSIVNQTLGIENIEVIIVDDCSTDNTYSIAKEYESKYPSFTVIRHEYNQGCGIGRNTGLKYVTTDYVTYLDGDDYISLNAYEKALEIFRKDKEIDLIMYKWEEFNENGLLNRRDISKDLLKKNRLITDINEFPELIFATYAYIKVYSKSLFEYLEFPPIYFQDNIASARVLVNAKKIFISEDITIYYRQHDSQATSVLNSEKYFDVFKAAKQVINLREDYLHYYDILSFLALKLVYHGIWYICKSSNFSLKEGEIIYPALKRFPKYFSKDILEKYQSLFPDYLPCSEQCLWNLEKMDYYEYLLKNRHQNDINRFKDENSSLRNKINDLENKNKKLRVKNAKLNKRIHQYKSRKIVRFTDKIRKLI